MTYILHLETATKVCSVALSKDGALIALKEIKEERYSHGENLTLLIQELMNDAGYSLRDLSAVSVSSGPGSYTGLRIGVSTAKGICYALEIPLLAVDALTALVEQVKEREEQPNLCALIDARRMEVYSLITDAKGNVLKAISADVIDERSYDEFEPFVYFGDGAAKLQEVWKARGRLEMDASFSSSAKGQVRLAYEKFKHGTFEDLAYFEPFYLKDFIAGKKESSGK